MFCSKCCTCKAYASTCNDTACWPNVCLSVVLDCNKLALLMKAGNCLLQAYSVLLLSIDADYTKCSSAFYNNKFFRFLQTWSRNEFRTHAVDVVTKWQLDALMTWQHDITYAACESDEIWWYYVLVFSTQSDSTVRWLTLFECAFITIQRWLLRELRNVNGPVTWYVVHCKWLQEVRCHIAYFIASSVFRL